MRRFGYVLASLVLLTVLFAASCTAPAAAPSPTVAGSKAAVIIVSPVSGIGGKDAYSIYGSGFAAGEKVKLTLVAAELTLQLAPAGSDGTVAANEYGAFVLKQTGFPVGIKPGVYTVTATGDKGSVATSAMQILAPAPPAPAK